MEPGQVNAAVEQAFNRKEELKWEATERFRSLPDIGKHNLAEASDAAKEVYIRKLPKGVRWWCNFSKSTTITNQLLLRPPAIVDIGPLDETAFQKKYKISISDMTRLAEVGAVLPNLYSRNIDEWVTEPEISKQYEGLLRRTIAQGEIADAYLEQHQRAKDGSSYSEFIGKCREPIVRAIYALPRHRLRAAATHLSMGLRASGEDDQKLADEIASISARNFGYLKVFAPETFQDEVGDRLTSRSTRGPDSDSCL
jgi:hypothetical protein